MTPPGPKSMKAIEDFYIKENVIDCLVMQNEYKNEFNNFNQSKMYKRLAFFVFEKKIIESIKKLKELKSPHKHIFIESDFNQKEIAYAAYQCALHAVNFTIFEYNNEDIFEIIQLP